MSTGAVPARCYFDSAPLTAAHCLRNMRLWQSAERMLDGSRFNWSLVPAPELYGSTMAPRDPAKGQSALQGCARSRSDRDRGEHADMANRVFELSQALEQKWLTADFPEKRQILEIVFLNLRLDNVTLRYEIREPFDVFAEGLADLSNRGDKTPVELFWDSFKESTTWARGLPAEDGPPTK